MKNNLNLRCEPISSDLETITLMVRNTGFFREDEVAVAGELVTERLEKGELSGYEFLIAESKGKVVAYACFGLIPCTVSSFDLYWIVTNKDYQNMGIGAILLREVETRVRDKGGTAIYVETSSQPLYMPTREFYERNHYYLKARFEDYYDLNDDKLVYLKSLG